MMIPTPRPTDRDRVPSSAVPVRWVSRRQQVLRDAAAVDRLLTGQSS